MGKPIEIKGFFWESDYARKSSGVVTIEQGEKPKLKVSNPLFDEESVKIVRISNHELSITRITDPDKIIADHLPRTIWGESEDSSALTLIDAQGGYDETDFNFNIGQKFESAFLVTGAHVAHDEVYRQARYSIDGPWATVLRDFDATFHELGGGKIRTYGDERTTWIEFSVTTGISLRQLENHFLLPCITLSGIALRRPLYIHQSQIRHDSRSDWLTLYANRSGRPMPKTALGQKLVPIESVTIDRLAAWVDLSAQAESLVDAVAGIDEGAPIESQVITLTAVAEGVHRKLHRKSVAFPELDRVQMRAIRRAARRAAIEKFEEYGVTDFEKINMAIGGALSLLGDLRFRARLEELVDSSRHYTPEALLCRFADWPKSVAYARNKIVHQLDDEDEDETPLPEIEKAAKREQLFDLLIAVSYSLSWLLRIVFLQKAGFAPETVRNGLLKDDRFEFAAANIANFMKGHPDEDNSDTENELERIPSPD